MWDAIEDQTQDIWRAFEDERYNRQKSIQDAFAFIQEQQNAIQLEEMEIDEKRFEIEDQLDPLWEQIDALHRQQEDIWHNEENNIDYRAIINDKHDQMDQLHNQMEGAWEQAEVDWAMLDTLRDEAYATHEAKMNEVQQLRTTSYDQDETQSDASGASEALITLEQKYNNDVATYQSLIAEQDNIIAQLSSASADSGAIDTSSLIAGVEAARSNLQSAKENSVSYTHLRAHET